MSNGSPAVTKTNANKFNECAKQSYKRGRGGGSVVHSASEWQGAEGGAKGGQSLRLNEANLHSFSLPRATSSHQPHSALLHPLTSAPLSLSTSLSLSLSLSISAHSQIYPVSKLNFVKSNCSLSLSLTHTLQRAIDRAFRPQNTASSQLSLFVAHLKSKFTTWHFKLSSSNTN